MMRLISMHVLYWGLCLLVASQARADGLPPEVTALSIIVTDPGEVIVNGTVGANDGNASVVVEFGPTTAYGSSVAATPSTVDDYMVKKVSAVVGGLDPATTYHLRIKAQNSFGTTYGQDTTVMPGQPVATTNAAVVTGYATVSLRGMVNGWGSNTTVSFEYGLTANYGLSVSATPAHVGAMTPTAVSATVSGLSSAKTYHCRVKATNLLGTVYGNDVTFVPGLPTATTLAATNINTGTARLQGTVSGNGLASTVNFEYGPTTSYGTVVPASPSGISTDQNTTPVSQSIGGLNPTITYHYRVYAVTTAGISPGEDMTFTPLSGTPPGATTVAATAVTAGGATMQGVVNANIQSTTVSFEYGTTTSYGNVVTGAPAAVTGNNDTAVTANISGFPRGTLIHYRVVAKNSTSTTNGADMTFTTTPDPPVVSLSGSPSLTASSAILAGSVVTGGGSTMVTFEYGLTTNYGESTPAWESPVSFSNGSVHGQISGLAAGTTYHYRLRAVSEGGSATSHDQTFTTLVAGPADFMVSTQEAAGVNSSQAILKGMVNNNSQNTLIVFEYGTTTQYGQSVGVPMNGLSDGAATAKISGLSPETTYHYRLRASGPAGVMYAADRTFTTPATGLLVASTAPARMLAPTVAELNAYVSANGGAAIISMGFEYGLDTSYGSSEALGGGISGTNLVAVKTTITAPNASTTYHYRIRATTATSTLFGEDMTFVTPDPNDASLASLTVHGVSLQPEFSPETTSYAASVPYEMHSIEISPMARQSLAVVEVNGFSVGAQGEFGAMLNVGGNSFNVVVRAIDGTTTQTYTLVVTRGQPKAGSLDFSFGGGTGRAAMNFGFLTNNGGSHLLIQPDGKILVVGHVSGASVDVKLVRLMPDGSMDASFNGTGMVVLGDGSRDDFGVALALQADGKIVVTGHTTGGGDSDLLVLRCNSDGTLDTTFNGTGMVVTAVGSGDDTAAGVVVQNDGSIVVAGTCLSDTGRDFAVVRYTSTGMLDTTFNQTGKVMTDFGGQFDESAIGVAVQGDGRLVVAGSSDTGGTHVARYTSAGVLDSSFNSTGLVTNSNGMSVKAMALQGDGKIVIAGTLYSGTDNDFALLRYTAAGELDTTFNTTGTVTTHFGTDSFDVLSSMVIQNDGKIVVAGRSFVSGLAAFAMVRYDAFGGLDGSFGGGGKVNLPFVEFDQGSSALALQGDGKLVTAGFADAISGGDLEVTRFLGDGPGIAVIHPLGGDLFDGLGSTEIGAVLPGATVSQTFTVMNSGLADLSGFGLTFTGTDAASFSATTTPAVPAPALASTRAMTLTVQFTPAATGIKTAVLHIASNVAGSNASFDIALKGVGLTHAENWRQTWFGSHEKTGDAADTADADADGIPNLLEYALGMNPTAPSTHQLPQPQTVSDDFVMSFPHPDGVSGVIYGAEWSGTMAANDWHAVSDTGMGNQHVFRAPIQGKTKLFMRITVSNP